MFQKQPNKWCDFLEDIRPSGYATYKSVKVEGKFLAFNRKGFGRSNAKRHDKATKFVERTRKEAIPKNVRPLKANNRYVRNLAGTGLILGITTITIKNMNNRDNSNK